jgi:hypothetical protein
VNHHDHEDRTRPSTDPRDALASGRPASQPLLVKSRSVKAVELRDVVELQYGAISRQQALACGLTDDAIQARLAARRWQQIYDGAYATFTGPQPRLTEIWAALLRAGEGATVGLWTAAELYGLTSGPSDVIHLWVPAGRHIALIPGVDVRRTRNLDEKRHPARLPPCTRVEETVLDLVDAARTVDEVLMWVTRAVQRRRTTPAHLREALSRRKRIRWRTELSAVISDVADGAHSVLEVEYRRRVERAHGLPPGKRQRPTISGPGRYVDVEYEEFSTRVELDGRVGHEAEGTFRDMDRDNATTIDGLDGLRYGWVHVFGRACATAGQVAKVLQCNGWTGHPTPCGPACELLIVTELHDRG